GMAVVRRLATRSERLLATAVAGLTAAGLLTATLAVAGGGITGSTWAHLGVPLGWCAAAVAVEVGVPAMAWAGVAGWTGVPWSPAPIEVADDPDGEDVAGLAATVVEHDDTAVMVGAASPQVLVWDVTEGLP